MSIERKRIDILLMERGLFESRSAARAAIMAGLVLVDGEKVDKPGSQVTDQIQVTVQKLPRYVSRGGLKLEKALQEFSIDVNGCIAMDVGASTGGFTDCLLQHGAAKVYCIDVGYGQLDWRLRQDERVVSLERTNIRHLLAEAITERIQFATIDVSFISLALVLPKLKSMEIAEIVALVKPQFEVGKGRVGKKGVVRDPLEHLSVLQKIGAMAADVGYTVMNASYSPIRGPEGNIEYLFHLLRSNAGEANIMPDFDSIVKSAHQSLLPL